MMRFTSVHIQHSSVWSPLTLSVIVSACGTLGPQDGPPARTISALDIQDATPQYEPLSKYGNPDSYVVNGKRYYVLDSAKGYVKQGIASWYGTKFHGRRTSSGEPYDMYAMSAAHKSLPLPTYVQVTNLDNQRTAIVKVNDRGPFHDDRIIDLSYAAAVKLGVAASGTAPVEVKTIEAPAGAELSAAQIHAPPQIQAITDNPQSGRSGHFVQVGAFADRGNAEQLQRRISQQVPFPVTINNANNNANNNTNGEYYRVRVGPFSDRQQVEDAESQLSDLGIRDTLILSD